ncbi:hypothetical protein CLU79DRAFT_753014 [Phycomyces nitens]|nr:hypothetical protein CLU79DRAFT_753014 [Phycomyces nitens]
MEESAPSTPEPHELQSAERSHVKKNKVARACDECRRKKAGSPQFHSFGLFHGLLCSWRLKKTGHA